MHIIFSKERSLHCLSSTLGFRLANMHLISVLLIEGL